MTLQRANTATPTFVAPMIPYDTMLAFGLKVLDSDGGAVSSNPTIVYVMVKHHPNILAWLAAMPQELLNSTTAATPQQHNQLSLTK